MSELRLEGLRTEVAGLVRPFFEETLKEWRDNVHSLYVVGSALSADFDPKGSDVNTVFVLRKIDFLFLEGVAKSGRKFRKKRLAAPLVMTPEHIKNSADVFPVEFLSFRLLHETVYGEDILGSIEISRSDLRRQCEREVKVKLIGLRQDFVSSLGRAGLLTTGIAASITGHIPLFRALIALLGGTPPVLYADVIAALSGAAGVDCRAFEKALEIKKGRFKPGTKELDALFAEYYGATERLESIVDEIKA